MKYTKKQIKAAYIKWHTECRLNPTGFLTDCETKDKDVNDAAETDTNTLIDYINV